jgi:hypothetical protein
VLLTVGSQKALVDKIVTMSKGIKPGNGSGQMGPVIDKASLGKIERYLKQAEDMGAEVLVDGRKWRGMEGTQEGGWWIGPTVILHKSKDDPAIKVRPLSMWLICRRRFSGRCCRFIKLRPRKKPSQLKIRHPLEMQRRSTLRQDWSPNGSQSAFQQAWWVLISVFLSRENLSPLEE